MYPSFGYLFLPQLCVFCWPAELVFANWFLSWQPLSPLMILISQWRCLLWDLLSISCLSCFVRLCGGHANIYVWHDSPLASCFVFKRKTDPFLFTMYCATLTLGITGIVWDVLPRREWGSVFLWVQRTQWLPRIIVFALKYIFKEFL